jgi:hypothetical protein
VEKQERHLNQVMMVNMTTDIIGDNVTPIQCEGHYTSLVFFLKPCHTNETNRKTSDKHKLWDIQYHI